MLPSLVRPLELGCAKAQPWRVGIPEQLHALIPAMLASFARRRGLPAGMLTSAVLQFEHILVIIGEHQRRQRSQSSAVPDAIIADYETEFMVGPWKLIDCKHVPCCNA